MAWGSRSSRTVPLPKNWPALRRKVLKRDGYTCTWINHNGVRCDQPATDVDHIGDPADHSLDNLRALCSPHHSKRTAHQGGKAAHAKRIPRKRPPEPHPGLIQ